MRERRSGRGSVLFQYLIVVTRDIIEDRTLPYYYELASGLVSERTRVSLFFTQGGVYAAQRNKHDAELRYFSKASIALWVDAASAQRRGFSARHLIRSVSPVLLSAVALAPKTFVFVDPATREGYSSQRALNLALRRGLDVNFFSHEETLNLIISRQEQANEQVASSPPLGGDWVALLLENLARRAGTLTWVDCGEMNELEATRPQGRAPLRSLTMP
jgi:sulfur relay (sulfurtransferase) complex TusBCD TusD component (DsrE family)